MKKLENIKTNTYQIRKNYRVDIQINETQDFKYEAWLYNPAYGRKNFMFGCDAKTEEEFLLLIEGNINNYIKIYREEVENEQ